MAEIYGKGIVALKQMLDNKEISPTELFQYFEKRADEHEGKIHSYITRASVDYNADRPTEGKLAGIPIAVKDIFCTKDLRTTAASKVLDEFIPKYESTATARLIAEGAWFTGKTNMDAWAHGASSETSAYGLTYNPWDLDRYPGGSSSGSASVVSAYVAPASIGTDTGGSIRHPASWCGILGLKPTHGRVSRYGVAAMGSSLDSPGPMGLYTEDLALLLEVMAGKDEYDATTSPSPVPNYTADMQTKRTFTLGIAKEYIDDATPDIQKRIMETVEILKKMGHTIKEVSLLDPKYAISAYTIINRAEVSSNLARLHGVRYSNPRNMFGEEAKRRSMLGAYALSHGYYDEYYKKAQKVRQLIRQSFADTFQSIDLILAPTAPVTALEVGSFEKYPFFGEMMDRLNEPASVAGIPAMSVPVGLDSNNLPVGMQIIGPALHESDLLNLSYQLEQETDFFGVIKQGLENWK